MAFENYPETEQKTTIVSPQKKNNTSKILIGVLVVALLGTWGFIIYNSNQHKQAVEQKDTMIATTSTQRDQLQKELEDAAMRYDVLKSSNSKKDSAITAKDRDIEAKKAQISQILAKSNATQAELSEAKRLISSLNGDIEGYQAQVAVLKTQNTHLVAEKAAVTVQRDKALKDYDSSTLVIKQKEDVIDVASTLHASNFNITGINEKNNGREKTTSTAKRVDKLRISFDLDPNMVAPSGQKELYVCITAPDGTPIAVQALGSGTFNTRDGSEKPYTEKVNVNYTQNAKQTVSFDWKQNSDFLTGNYKIEVYNNGFKVGESYKPLKKGGLFS